MRTARSLSLLLFFFLTACASMVARPEWRLQGIRVDQLDLSKATLGLDAQITNPNGFKITIRQVRYRLYLKEALVAQGERAEELELPGGAMTDVWLPVEVSLREARKLLPLLKETARKEDLNWRIEGECTLKALGVEKVLPFKKETPFTPPA